MSDTISEFMSAHNDVLVLRKRIEKMRHDLLIAESTLRDAERESAVLFRKLYDRPTRPSYHTSVDATASGARNFDAAQAGAMVRSASKALAVTNGQSGGAA